MRQVELVVAATFDDVAWATEFLRGELPDWLDGARCDAIEVALAETLTNIVEHGYASIGRGRIRVRLSDRRNALEVDVWDYGNPIPDDQLEHAGSSTFDFEPTDTGALPEGGMGLALIKAAFDEVDYASDGRENWLHLILHFRSTHLSRRLGHA